MTTGQVVTIHTVRERDGVAEARPETTVRSDFGLEGDWRSRSGSPRQVTLIDEEWLQATGARLGYPVPPGATRRQVTVRGLPLRDLVGKTLQAGDVLLAVTEPCDPCENMNRKIGEGAREALQGWGGVSARVVQGGTLRAGDAIVVREAAPGAPAQVEPDRGPHQGRASAASDPGRGGAKRATWEGVGTVGS
ncbi:MAG TPA: MOSC domain-containing protein [Chloroflexota bacterium]|nr:MOSC domain-containing protein [Chloroflexota bacterium]